MSKFIKFDLYKITFSFLILNLLFLPLLAYGVYRSGYSYEYSGIIFGCIVFLAVCDLTPNPAIRKIEIDAWLSSRIASPLLFFFPVTITEQERKEIKSKKHKE